MIYQDNQINDSMFHTVITFETLAQGYIVLLFGDRGGCSDLFNTPNPLSHITLSPYTMLTLTAAFGHNQNENLYILFYHKTLHKLYSGVIGNIMQAAF